VLDAVADFDELCPRPLTWPRPKKKFGMLSDPLSALVISGALDLVRSAGSEELNKTLGAALEEVGGFGG
jgi:hypothetical protein